MRDGFYASQTDFLVSNSFSKSSRHYYSVGVKIKEREKIHALATLATKS